MHVTAAGHDAKDLSRLAKLIHSREQLLFKALQVDSARLARHTRPVDEAFLRRIFHSRPEEFRDLNRPRCGRRNRRIV